MKRFYAGLLCAAGAFAAPATAGDQVLYDKAPQWVLPVDFATALKSRDEMILVDRQRRLEDGTELSYNDFAFRLTSPDAITNLGTLSLQWLPDKGDLTVHRLEIHRRGEVIDLLGDGVRFEVLRRETGLEQRTLDGARTATLAVPGLRVGDVLRFTTTISQRDQALDGDVQLAEGLPAAPTKIGFGRMVVSWPKDQEMSWRAGPRVDLGSPVERDGYKVFEVSLPLPKQDEMPEDAPGRYLMEPLLQVGSFASWSEVSARLAPYFATDGKIAAGSPVATEVERIKRTARAPLERAALALQLVQDEVGYLANGMDGGNYIPQAPADTWSSRLGDCKAKSLLLVAMLREMGIESEVVAVHSERGDAVAAFLPMPAAFDHVIVRAVIDGQEYWLDGTNSGTRLSTIAEVPDFENALPLRPGGAELMAISQHWQPRPDRIIRTTYDHSAGVDMPTIYDAEIELAGVMASRVRAAAGETDKTKVWAFVSDYIKDLYPDSVVTSSSIRYDDKSGLATIKLTGVEFDQWKLEGARASYAPILASTGRAFAPDRARPAWREIPVQTGGPLRLREEVTIILPDGGEGYTLSGLQDFAGEIAGEKIERHMTREGDKIRIVDDLSEIPQEIAPAQIAAEKANVSRFASGDPVIQAPQGAPRSWQVPPKNVAQRYRRLEQVMAQLIADEPSDVWRHMLRGAIRAQGFDREGAAADFDKALAIAPSADLYRNRAENYRNLGKEDLAIAEARQANDLEPSTGNTTYLAALLGEAGETAEARELLESLDVSGDDRIGVMQMRAELAGQEGRLDEGWGLLEAALAERPQSPQLLNAQCWYSATWKHRLDQAEALCTKAVEASQWSASVLDSRALVYYRLGRSDDALSDLEAALRNTPDIAASRYLRGIIRSERGEAKGAEDIQAALRQVPYISRYYARYGINPPK